MCLKSRDENQRAIDEFADQWRVKAADRAADDPADPFDCFYDVSDPGRVIPHKTYSRADVVHCMLWPSLVVVASAVTFLYLEARRSRLTFCGRRPSVVLVDGEKSQLKLASSSSSHAAKVFSSSSKYSEQQQQQQQAAVNDQHALSKPAAETMSSKLSGLHAARQRDLRHPLPPAAERLNGQVLVRSSVDVRRMSPTGAAADGPASRRARRLHDRSAAAVAAKSHSASSLVAAGVETTASDLGRPAAACADERRSRAAGRRPLSGGSDNDKPVVGRALDSTSSRCASETHLYTAI